MIRSERLVLRGWREGDRKPWAAGGSASAAKVSERRENSGGAR